MVDKYKIALNLRNSGFSYERMGKSLGVSRGKARLITAKAKRLNKVNHDNDTPEDQKAANAT